MSEKKYKYIIFTINNGIGTIILNRPHQLNALKYLLLNEIIDALNFSMNEGSIRTLVLRGNGQSFCAGDDLKNMEEEGEEATTQIKQPNDGSIIPHHSVIRLIREIQKPVIALIQGHCLGAGFEISLACDIRLAADNLIIGDHRAKRAICVISGASWFLPRIVGFGRATEIIMTGRHLDAKESLEIGLVNKIYPLSEFEEKSLEFIQEIAKLPTACLGYNKAMLNYSQNNELFPSLQHELELFIQNMTSHDYSEGIKSFLEKRPPNFNGK